MSSVRTCDRSDCPAIAIHHIDLYGQDFHFCGHHWAELSPVLLARMSPWEREQARRSTGDDRPSSLAGAGSGRPSR